MCRGDRATAVFTRLLIKLSLLARFGTLEYLRQTFAETRIRIGQAAPGTQVRGPQYILLETTRLREQAKAQAQLLPDRAFVREMYEREKPKVVAAMKLTDTFRIVIGKKRSSVHPHG